MHPPVETATVTGLRFTMLGKIAVLSAASSTVLISTRRSRHAANASRLTSASSVAAITSSRPRTSAASNWRRDTSRSCRSASSAVVLPNAGATTVTRAPTSMSELDLARRHVAAADDEAGLVREVQEQRQPVHGWSNRSLVVPAMYGCSASGTRTLPSACWWFSSTAMRVRPTARPEPFSVCTNAVPSPAR